MATDITEVKDEGTKIVLVQGGSYTVAKTVEYAGEISDLSFLQLSDTPESYEKQAGKTVTVNEDGNGLSFSKTYDNFISLKDTPNKYEGHLGSLVIVKKDGSGLSFVNYTIGDIHIEYFTQLADVPNTYENKQNNLLVINEDASGIDFKALDDVLPNQNVTPGTYNYPHIVLDKKGRITGIEEGKPFEFPPFNSGELLIGDGSSTPITLTKGKYNQFLGNSIENQSAEWQYISSLFTEDGKLGLTVTKEAGNFQSPLHISATQSYILIEPAGNQSLKINSRDQMAISARSFNIDGTENQNSEITLRGSLNLSTDYALNLTSYLDIISINSAHGINLTGPVQINGVLSSPGNLILNPNNGKLSVSSTIAPQNYVQRITNGNDFATKEYVDQAISANIVYLTKSKTVQVPVDGSYVSMKIGKGILKGFTIYTTEEPNSNCSLNIEDSLGNILINPDDIPQITFEGIELYYFMDTTKLTDDYAIKVSFNNRTSGNAYIFVNYIKGG